VDEVHNNSILAEFWQYGRNVVNPNTETPIHADIVDPTGVVPEEIKKVDFYCYYGLDTNLDPEKRTGHGRDYYNEGGPVEKQSTFRAFALALVLGEKPARRWLVFAYAPRNEEKDVEITIPDYGKIKVNAPQGGVYYHVQEKDKSCKPVALTTE